MALPVMLAVRHRPHIQIVFDTKDKNNKDILGLRK